MVLYTCGSRNRTKHREKFMAKRFTDTEIWEKEWFMELSPKHKTLIMYLYSRCDAAGVWDINWGLASIFIGDKVCAEDLHKIADHVSVMSHKKLFIPGFIKFQYGKLSRDCKPHIPIYRLLEKHGIDVNEVEMTEGVGKTHNISDLQRMKIFKQDEYTCCYCGKEKDERTLVVDHVVPRKKGGEDSIKNCVASCQPCNSKKSDFSLLEFCGRNDLDFKYISERVSQRLSKRLLKSLKEKEKEKDKEMEEEKEEEMEEEKGGKKIDFEIFWNAYEKKIGDKEKLKKKWDRLPLIEQQMAMTYIPRYKESTADKQYRKNPETFLNNKSWNDEIITPHGNTDKQQPTSKTDRTIAGVNSILQQRGIDPNAFLQQAEPN
jgi:HNH endonuclease